MVTIRSARDARHTGEVVAQGSGHRDDHVGLLVGAMHQRRQEPGPPAARLGQHLRRGGPLADQDLRIGSPASRLAQTAARLQLGAGGDQRIGPIAMQEAGEEGRYFSPGGGLRGRITGRISHGRATGSARSGASPRGHASRPSDGAAATSGGICELSTPPRRVENQTASWPALRQGARARTASSSARRRRSGR